MMKSDFDEQLSVLKVIFLIAAGGGGPVGARPHVCDQSGKKKKKKKNTGSSLLTEVTHSPSAYVKDVCCRCQTVGHMLQQGLVLQHRARTRRW